MASREAVLGLACLVIAGFIVWMVANRKKESYKRSELGQACNMDRTPVDYVMYDWAANPKYQARPASTRQPLEAGPIDLYADERKLDTAYPMFSQYGHYYPGCFSGCLESGGGVFITDDIKGRADLTNIGDLSLVRQLKDMAVPFKDDPRFLHDMNFADVISTSESYPPYGYSEAVGS